MPNPFAARRNLRRLADEDLVELVHSGDARAFDVIFERHSGPAFSLAFRICGSRSRAEDIVQDAFLSVWRSGARYDRARGSVRSWLLGVVHHRAIDVLRREAARGAGRTVEESFAQDVASSRLTDVEAEQRDDAERVRRALGQLPQEQKRVIELAYFGGFTHQEIAEMLSLPAGTVKGRMRLGLGKLRIELGEQGLIT
jgi:RNA polymerase sigma-70 factor (ECF subfamily)